MKSSAFNRLVAALVVATGAIAIVVPQATRAAGTASNISIDNMATVNYEVSGAPQTPIESAPGVGNSNPGIGAGNVTSFLVDNKVNLTVANPDLGYVPVSANSTGGTGVNVMTFSVTNNGNTTQDYALSLNNGAVNDPYNGNLPDDINVSAANIYVESNAGCNVPQTFDETTDTATFIDNLAADACRIVYVVANIGAANAADVASVELFATTYDAAGAASTLTSQNAGADNALAVDVVFADGEDTEVPGDANRDGIGSARGSYQVVAATLTVSKNSAVTWDPFWGFVGAGNFPKAIPGSVVTYTVTVSNAAGGSGASNVVVTDDLTAMIVTNPYMSFNTQFNDGTLNCGVGNGIVLDGVCLDNDNAGAPDDGGDFGATAANTLTVNIPSLAAGANAVIRYQMVITP